MIEEIKKLNVGDVLIDVDLSRYTTYKLKSVGKILVIPNGIDELKVLIKYIKDNNLKYKILGNGSNLIFVNPIYDGILIKLDKLNDLKIDGNKVTVGAGYSFMKLALKTCMMGLSGLEFATGIPGSIGGAVYMNAGAYNSDVSSVLKSAVILNSDLEIVEFKNKDFNFGYRTSILQGKDFICLSAKFNLNYGSITEIMDLVNDRRERRIKGQPLEYPSAGSVFRNPTGDYAGRLIEEIGYKGKSIGGASVSLKHANFIINSGNATGENIKDLIFDIKEKVKEKYNIDLKVEQEFVE